MHKTAFETSYTSVTEDGAQWILDNTEIGLVGIDYTSVAIYEDLLGPHRLFLPASGPVNALLSACNAHCPLKRGTLLP